MGNENTKKSPKHYDVDERMTPEVHKGSLIYAEHLLRYRCAQDIVAGKIVLDIACGSGYGSQILAQSAKQVIGVDLSQVAIDYAKKNFAGKNLSYLVGGAESIPLEDSSVDVVVTFETIEHIKDYRQFIREIKRILKPNGLAIVSTPNRLEFAEGNHFHVHEFEHDELTGLLKKDFKNLKLYYQATWKYAAIGDEALFSQENQTNIPTLNLSHLPKTKWLYFYFLCSNRQIKETLKPLAAIGEHYSDKQQIAQHLAAQQEIVESDKQKVELQKEITAIKNSKSYRLAQKISRLDKALRRKK